jgi:hypothetical protein
MHQFNYEDPALALASWVFGWWNVTWRNQTYFYWFDSSGRVSYTQQQPANLQQPPFNPISKGYWFSSDGANITICWTETGSVETFFQVFGIMNGFWNGTEPLLATRLA